MKSHSSNRFLAACFFCALSASLAHATTYYWDNDGTTAGFGTANGTWAAPTTGNSSQGWSTSATGILLPGDITTLNTNATTDAVNFGNTTTGLAAGTITVSGPVASGNMTFAAGSGAITLSGGTITLAAASIITVNNSTDTIDSILAGTTFSTVGTGTLVLTKDNTSTLTGAVTLGTNSTMAVGNDGALGTGLMNFAGGVGSPVTFRSADANPRTLANNIAFNSTDYIFGSATTGNLILTGNANIGSAQKFFTVLNGVTDFRGVISTTSGTSTKTKLGGGTLVFSGANTYAGATAVTAGTLRLNYDTGVGGTDVSKLADASALNLGGGTLELSGGTHTELVSATALTAGTGSFVTRASGTSVLRMNVITRAAGATINFGAAGIADTDTLNNANGILGTWATVGGTDWAINSTNAADGPITAYSVYTDVTRLSSGTKAIADGPTTNVRIIEGTGSAANLTLGAATTTINTLNQSVSGGTAAATIDPAGQTLAVAGILVGSGAGGLTIGTGVSDGTLTAAIAGGELLLNNLSSNTLAIKSVIADFTSASSLTKSGSGTVTLTGANTYTGATNISAGTLEIGGSGTLGAGAYAGAFANNGTLRFNGTAAQAFSGAISGIGALIKDNSAALTLSGAKTYTGATTVNTGRLLLQNTTTFPSAITNSSEVEFNSTGTTSLIQGAIGGAGTYIKTGTGVTQFNLAGQAITASGQFNIQAGTLQNNGNSVNWSGAASVDISATAILDLFADPIKIDKLTGTGFVQNNFGNTAAASSGAAAFYEKLTVGFANGSSTFDGVIRNNATGATPAANTGNGAVDLEKVGTGTLTLTGSNTYTGVTKVTGGKLLVNNTTGNGIGTGAVTVATTATLGGTGTVAGATTVQSGGTLAPGASAGNLTFGSTVDLQNGSTYAAEIASAVSNDKITASGTFTVGGTIKVTLLGGYSPAVNTVFDVADATIAGSPTIANFDFTAATLGAGLSWDISSFATDGTIKVVSGADPFTAWATANGVTGGKGGDDDNDGVKNLLEFATASNPKSGSSGARVYPLVQTIGGVNVLTYTVAVRAGATFAASGSKQQADKDLVRYTVEASDQLGTWNTVVVTELAAPDATAVQAALGAKLSGLDPAWTWHSFRTDGDTASDPADFIRLQVTETP